MGELIYIPKLPLRHIVRYNVELNTIDKHPYGLISIGHENDTKNVRKILGNKITLIGDSGGFQYASGKLRNKRKIYALNILRWYRDNRIDLGILLDYPPISMKSLSIVDVGITEKELNDRLEFTKKYHKLMLENKHICPDTRLLKVLHGGNAKIIDKWGEEINMLSESDFWALSPKARTYRDRPPVLLLQFAKLIEMNAVFAHVLGVGDADSFEVMNAASKFFGTVTFDTSKPIQHAVNKSYLYLEGNKLKASRIGLRSSKRVAKIDYECNCPICKVHGIEDFIRKSINSNLLLYEHGVYTLLEYYNRLSAIENDRYLEFFEFVERKGFWKAYEKYREKLKLKEIETKKIIKFVSIEEWV